MARTRRKPCERGRIAGWLGVTHRLGLRHRSASAIRSSPEVPPLPQAGYGRCRSDNQCRFAGPSAESAHGSPLRGGSAWLDLSRWRHGSCDTPASRPFSAAFIHVWQSSVFGRGTSNGWRSCQRSCPTLLSTPASSARLVGPLMRHSAIRTDGGWRNARCGSTRHTGYRPLHGSSGTMASCWSPPSRY